MAKEVELKLALAEQDQQRFLRLPLLKQALSRQTETLANHYYDTPSQTLQRHGIALRLRRQGRRWLQTVKCAGESRGGLSSRPEWEVPYRGHFDFSTVDDAEVRRRLERPTLQQRLTPLFATDFRRTTWRLAPTPGTVVLLALDRGTITTAGRQETICEVELELEQGDVQQLFAVAEALAADINLTPALLSKAERGYQLLEGKEKKTAKSSISPLVPDMVPLEAFRRIALSCLEQFQANRQGAVDDTDPEYLHQMRVAARRLRAALRLFEPLLPDQFTPTLLPPLRSLVAALGPARDLDVLYADIVAPALDALPADTDLTLLAGRVADHQQAMRKVARTALETPAYGQFLLLFARLLYQLPTGNPATVRIPLVDFANEQLSKLRRNVCRLAREAQVDDADSLHALRIGIKRLRYSAEFFSPLLGRKARNLLLRRLSDGQDLLGALNDFANAGPSLHVCTGHNPKLQAAMQRIADWHMPHYQALVVQVPELLSTLQRLPQPRGKKKWT